MRAAKKITVDKQLLQEFVPLNALSAERFKGVSEKIIIEEVLAGRYLFRKGDRDNQSIFLLEGKINLIDGFRKVASEIEAGTDISRHAIANQQPRLQSARAVKKCIIARIDSGLLDVFLTWDQSSTAEVIEIGADEDQDWMTRILQTEAFIKIPPAMIQSLLIKMESCPVKAGDVVVRQGDAGDFFYTIHEGRCAVTRKESPDAVDQFLAELGDGSSFGEDALISDIKRNATVTMLTDGLLMRLAKEDFIELLKNQLVKHVDYDQAAALVDEGAVWVDVRTVDEYENGAFEDSVNIPLSSLRNELSELVFNTKYIVCCDTGRRSESAGFMLSHKGYDVFVLEDGITDASFDANVIAGVSAEDEEELAALRAEKEDLLLGIKEYQSAEARMAEQIEQLGDEVGESTEKLGGLYAQAKTDAEQSEQLRAELGESAEKLDVLHLQVKNDAEEVQLLQDQYAALQEKHAEAVNTHTQKSDQLDEKLNEMQLQMDASRNENEVLKHDVVASETVQQEIQQLQDALGQANERVSVLESDVVKSDEAGSELLGEAQGQVQEQQEVVVQLREELSAAVQSLEESREAAKASEAGQEASEAALQEKLQQQAELSERLQADLEGLQQQASETVGKLEQESGQAVTLAQENADLLKIVEEIQAAADVSGQEYAVASETVQQEIQQLQDTLTQANERVSVLESDVVKSDEAGSELLGEAQGQFQEQQEVVAQLREELSAAVQSLEESREAAKASEAGQEASEAALQEKLQQQTGASEKLQEELQQQAELSERLQADLEGLQQQASETAGKLEQESGQAVTLAQENADLLKIVEEMQAAADAGGQDYEATLAAVKEQNQQLEQQLEDLQSAADAGSQEREAALAAAKEQNQQLEQQLEDLQSVADAGSQEHEAAFAAAKEQNQRLELQLEELQASFSEQQQALSAVSGESENSAGEVQSLQQDNEKLRTELQETALLLDEQGEEAGNHLSARQAAEEALEKLQAEWESERDALQKTAEDERSAVETLGKELEQLEVKNQQDKIVLEKQQQEQLEKVREQAERLESENVQLRDEQSAHAEELGLATTERTKLQQSLNEVTEENSGLESELASLREQATGLVESSNEELQLLQGQLEEEQRRVAGFEQAGSDKEVQIRDLQQEILQSGEGRSTLEQELESLRQQHESSHVQLEQQAERIQELEQEHNESIQKAHDDLTRKNDNEKELQGQIDRLRKKLEQSSLDQKKARDGSQTDVDNIREELHAERKARDEERAEMAGRQRELKEQLTAIALEHEANLSNHSGAIEKAKDAGREEDQERLRKLIEAQSQSEEQLLSLQQELQKAHADISELTRTEKDRRQVDMDMMQEQNQQAVSTITQLESQLRQLTQDRDTALTEQQTLREKINTLRGEVEVTRGLMSVGSEGQVDDPGQLRHELSESKKNITIALRLRAEAEAARDQLIEERNVLREKLGEEAASTAPLRVLALDAGKRAAADAEPQASAKQSAQPASVSADKGGGQRRWLGAAIGLGVVGAVAVTVWFLIGAGNPLPGINEPPATAVVAEPVGKAEKPAVKAAPVSPAAPPVKAATPPARAPEKVVVAPVAPVVAKPVEQPVPKKVAPAPKKVAPAPKKVEPAPEPVPPAAPRSFQDSLQGGGKGPVMVELLAGDFLMGSTGNSLNFDESPRHKVTLDGFSISKQEVTFAEYDKFARATGRRLPNDESWGRADRPVINVSWNDARAYAEWLSKKTGKRYRLPTEAEWEYAARAGSTGKVWWDTNAKVKPANCFNCGSEWDGKRTAPAGSFSGNAFGLLDMAGNAQEWTEDCYQTGYTGAPDNGTAWLTPECTQRVVRGGSYSNPLDTLRNAKRSQYNQDARLDNLGFRIIRSH